MSVHLCTSSSFVGAERQLCYRRTDRVDQDCILIEAPQCRVSTPLLTLSGFLLRWEFAREMRHVRPGVRWDYFLKIPAKDVPLSHKVVIDVFTRDRIALGRLSAGVG